MNNNKEKQALYLGQLILSIFTIGFYIASIFNNDFITIAYSLLTILLVEISYSYFKTANNKKYGILFLVAAVISLIVLIVELMN